MKNRILFILIASGMLCTASFAQKGKIGITGRPMNNGEYVEIAEITPGMPAQMAGLKASDRILLIDGKNVGQGSNWLELMSGPSGEQVKLTIRRFGNPTPFDVTITRISPSGKPVSEGDIMVKILTNEFTRYGVGGMCNGALSVLHDNTCDFFRFKTYDYEYTSQSDPLLEKVIMKMVGKRLDNMGLKRDQINPDLLLVITFYSGKKEQYIPPQQIISTKIKQSYNLFWGYIPVPVTESTTTPGYTEVTYMTNVGLKFLDADEISKSKVPPVVWSGIFTETSQNQVYLNESADRYLSFLMNQFPVTWFQNSNRFYLDDYPYTGILYDLDDLKIISEVNPGSPAWQAGIRKGDKIVTINGYGLPKDYDSPGPLKFNIMADKGGLSGLRYLYLYANIKFKPYKKSPDNLVFKIKRDGKSMTFQVKPEKKQFYRMFKE